MLILRKALGWMEDEVKVLCELVRNDLNDPCIRAYVDVYVVSIVFMLEQFADDPHSSVTYSSKSFR